MRPGDIIRAALARTPVSRVSDLLALGVSRSSLNDAAGRGDLVRLAHGVVGGPGTDTVARIDDAVACLVTGGIICNRSAATRLGLTDDAPGELELLVSAQDAGKAPVTFPARLRRYSNPLLGTLGVETETVAGIPVRMTGPARTVVDQYRYGVPEQHLLQALHTYLGEGGDGNTLQAICQALGPRAWDAMQRDIANIGLARARTYSRETDDEPEREQDDDHGDGPAFVRGGP